MIKNIQKAISLIIIFCLLIQTIPVSALTNNVIEKDYNQPIIKKEETSNRKIIKEIVEKREENKKYFKMNDGSEKINLYSTPIHFKENGKYVDINNELIKKGNVYENKKASYKVNYNIQNEQDNLLKIDKDNYTLSMSLENSEKSTAKIIKEKTAKNNLESKEAIPEISSQIEYKDIKENVDINYITLPTKVKESIVLKEKNAAKEFKYIIKLNKELKAEIKSHNIIEFKDKDSVIFTIETPYMYDQEFNLSTDIKISLEKNNTDYILTIAPDKKWLNDKERKYPVTIDPTINTSQIRDQIDDLFIYQGDDNVDPYAKANQHILRVGSNRFSGTNKNPTRSLIKFNLPSLNTGDQVIDAKMALYSYACSLEDGISCPDGKTIEINAHKVTKDWNDNNAKWSYLKDAYDPKIADYQMFKFDWNNQIKLYEFDITSIVKDWYLSGTNSGIMLKENSEVYNLNREDAYFFSSDINDKYATARPVASIVYRNQTGIESYQTYNTHEIDNVDVSINHYNGNLVLTHNDASTPGGKLPVTINHVYNTNDKDINIGYGNGFRLNLNQTLVNDNNYIKYTDEDGTKHWFKKDGNKYVDEDGLNLTLTSSNNNYIMEDKEGNKSFFTKNGNTWYLTEITDTSNNKITISLDSNNLITKVTDGANDEINLKYTNNKLSKIVDKAGRETNYTYTNNNLTTITYSNKEKQSLEYVNNQITKIIGLDQSYNSYEYYQNAPYRLKKVSEYGSNDTLGNSLEFIYGDNVTSIKNNKNKITNYIFNNHGLTTSITDLGDKTTPIEAYGQEFTFDTSDGNNKNKLLSEGNLIKTTGDEISTIFTDDGEGATPWDLVRLGDGSIDKTEEEKHSGNNSYKMELKNKEMFLMTRPIDINMGQTYTFSAFIKGNISDKDKDGGLFFEVSYMTDDNGNTKNINLNSESLNITDKWEKYEFTFTVPQQAPISTPQMRLVFQKANGTAYIDDIVLKDGTASDNLGPKNLVTNNGFNKQLTSWKTINTTNKDSIITEEGNNVVKIVGDPNQYKGYEQYIEISGKKGDVFNTSAWVLNNGTPQKNTKTTKLLFELLDGNNKVLQSVELHVAPNSQSWQFISKYITANTDYKKIKILFGHMYQRGYALFDNIAVYKGENSVNYAYDDNGNVINTKDNANQKSNLIYDKQNQLVMNSNNKDRTTLYSYNHNHKNRLLKTTTQDGIEVENSYDNYGNITSTKTKEKKVISLRNIDSNKEYHIKTYNNNLYIGADNVNLNKAGLKLLNKSDNTKFKFKLDQNGLYEIISAKSNNSFAIDIDGASTNNNVAAQLYNPNNTDAQRFKIVANQNGTYSFQTKITNYEKCLDITNANISLNTNIQQYTCNNSNAQLFTLEEVEDNDYEKIDSIDEITKNKIYYIKTVANDLYIQPNTKEPGNSTPLILNPLNESAEWKINETSGGKFRLESNYKNNLIWDVKSGGTANSIPIQLWTYSTNEYPAQVFDIYQNKDSTFSFKTKSSNYTKCVDVDAAIFEEKRIIQQYDCNSSLAQKFIIFEKNENKRKYTETKAEYTENGNFKTKDINENEKAITYTNNENTGTITSIKDAKNNTVNYEYNSKDQITKITNGNTVNNYTYSLGKLTEIKHNNFNYNFIYDEFGNTKETKVGNQSLIRNTYEEKNGNLLNSTYGNGHQISYSYDSFDRLESKTQGDKITYYLYDNRGNIGKIKDGNHETYYTYDLSGRLIGKESSDFKTNYTYNKYSELEKIKYEYQNKEKEITNTYDLDGKLTKSNNIKYSYDKLNRISKKNIDSKYNIKYSYKNISEEKTTNILDSITNGQNKISYTYDNNGNIETIKENNTLINEYEYDNLNQLIKEHNVDLNNTIVYNYDSGGNILSKKYYEYKTNNLIKEIAYAYNNNNWKDQLTNYNNKEITYDAIGNPLTYDNQTFTWQNGRELQAIKKGDTNITYKYNEEGIRTSKTNDGKETKYYLDGFNIIFEERPEGTIYYMYNNNEIIGLEYNNQKYYYLKNGQNDIIGLLDENFNQIANYTYDSWGNIISVTGNDNKEITNKNNIAHINPFRYKSYYYDEDTNLYYLNSRYYSPEWNRFLNADGIMGANKDDLGYNLYTYVSNNPINLIDEDGEVAIAAIGAVGSTGVIGGVLITIGIIYGSAILIQGMAGIASNAATSSPAKSKSKSKQQDNRKYTVYTLQDKKDNVIYVGRTINPKTREKQHRKNIYRQELKFLKEYENLSKEEARGIEQSLILKYQTLNKNNPAANQINGIRWDNKKCSDYITQSSPFLSENETYVGYCKN